jgi:2-haloacid dehalogenase
MSIDPLAITALVFDVFGTVVDWRGSILRDLPAWGKARGLAIDWAGFADDWRAGYQPAMAPVREGKVPFRTIDALHCEILDGLLVKYGIAGLSEADKDHLNRVWHRLDPWPDAVRGLWRLKQRFTIGTLSNGNVALLVNMAKHAGLPWDVVLSAELAGNYKPDPSVYRLAPSLLGLEPRAVVMVAAHEGDLAAAAKSGLRTAYVARPLEFGPGKAPHRDPEGVDVVARDFNHLADLLGA